MKQLLRSRLAIIFLLIPSIIFAEGCETIEKAKYTKEKSMQKSFDVSPDATLKVNNSYGNIDVITWNENRIEFDIIIKVSGNNEEKVEKRLEEIDVKFSSSNNLVSAETMFGKKKSNSWWNWGKKSKLKMEINYVIKIPATNNVNLNNDYGGINLDKLEGKAQLNCDYGKITTKELMADGNIINFDYSRNCYFEYIKSGKINADYSGFTIAKAKSLDINADYTKSVIEVAEDVNYNCDYNGITINSANNVTGNGDYVAVRLGTIYKNASIKSDYGSIKIDRMASNAGNLDIESDYAGITIGYDSGYNFDFRIKLQNAGLRNTDDFEFNKRRIQSRDKYYEGYHGNPGSGNTVTINSEYGSVTFKKK